MPMKDSRSFWLKVDIVSEDRVRIAGVAHKEHVGELELGFGNAVI